MRTLSMPGGDGRGTGLASLEGFQELAGIYRRCGFSFWVRTIAAEHRSNQASAPVTPSPCQARRDAQGLESRLYHERASRRIRLYSRPRKEKRSLWTKPRGRRRMLPRVRSKATPPPFETAFEPSATRASTPFVLCSDTGLLPMTSPEPSSTRNRPSLVSLRHQHPRVAR